MMRTPTDYLISSAAGFHYCKVLSPYGYYEFDYVDEDGWPHYKTNTELPFLKAGEQSILMKEAIVNYFVETEFIQ